MISVTVSGMDGLMKSINKLNTLKTPLQTAMNEIGTKWVERIHEGMESAGSPSSPGGFPGVASGMLMGSIADHVSGWSSVTITTNVEYAQYLQDGTSKMLARPFLPDAGFSEFITQFENIIGIRLRQYVER
jgi:hypothetical protein